eukprot:gene14076-biopygen9614
MSFAQELKPRACRTPPPPWPFSLAEPALLRRAVPPAPPSGGAAGAAPPPPAAASGCVPSAAQEPLEPVGRNGTARVRSAPAAVSPCWGIVARSITTPPHTPSRASAAEGSAERRTCRWRCVPPAACARWNHGAWPAPPDPRGSPGSPGARFRRRWSVAVHGVSDMFQHLFGKIGL